MATLSVILKSEKDDLIRSLGESRDQLDGAGGEIVLNFSAVRRVDADVLYAMQQLADAAEGKGVKLALQSVNGDIYKVLKLLKLAPRFRYLD